MVHWKSMLRVLPSMLNCDVFTLVVVRFCIEEWFIAAGAK